MAVMVAIYARLSEEDRVKINETDASQSIQNQISMLTSYAEANQWQIYKVYSDDDYTGADRSRPAFNALLRDAEEKKFSIILCKSQSRFTREMELVEHYLHDLFPRWGIRFIGLVDNADTANKGNKKARQINGLVNEWYLEDLSENIKETLTDRRKKGYHIGSFAPYGYKKDPEYKGHLLPDDEAAAVVRRIFEMYAAGIGRTAIARQLNAEGVPNPTRYKQLHNINWKRNLNTKRPGLWQYFSISDILANEVYIGNLVQGRYESISYKTHENKPTPKEKWIRVENTHAPIIDRDLWDRVQKIRGERARPGWDGEVGIFAHKARCMYCGYVMHSKKLRDGRRYLACSTAMIGKDICQGSSISVKELERTVLKELHVMIAQYLDMDEAEKELQFDNAREREMTQLQKDETELKNKIELCERAIKTLYSDRVEGIIGLQDYQTMSESYRQDAERYRKRIAEIKDKVQDLLYNKQKDVSKREILEQFSGITELTYDIVNILIDYVEVGRREGHYRHADVPVIIHWLF